MQSSFVEASEVLNKLKEAGYKAYFVGGSVRDYLMEREIGDIDIATNATPEEVMSLFSKTIPVGLKHGTVIVRHRHESYEVTTFRKESNYEDKRHPSSVVFIDSLYEDLARRDFTMNAMAMDENGEIYDPYNGRKAIQLKQIETVGDASHRFQEDPLRIMRALRFMSVYGFSLEEKTKQACIQLSHELKAISVERMAVEFIKLLAGSHCSGALKMIDEYHIYRFLPALSEYDQSFKALFPIDWDRLESNEERWTLLLFLLGVDDIPSFLRKWKLPNSLIKKAVKLISFIDKPLSLWDIYRLGLKDSLSCQRMSNLLNGRTPYHDFKKIKEQYDSLAIKSRKDIALETNAIVNVIAKKRGPWINTLLSEMQKAIVEKRLKNNEKELMEWVRRWKENETTTS
ncbi:CCA tRNA nucleotidyltransferase [Fictibacillus gelatini]|uniref:CCA tRNA nucleotidyltransferase n=1 Tax=Fictibacillus gelatini TaxID=225985 RepID=UPI0003F97755|nr:CCA tRNA nucleotidyltransferase [Fictibacillus gelatini]